MLRNLRYVVPEEQHIRLRDPAFITAVNRELFSSSASEVCESVGVLSSLEGGVVPSSMAQVVGEKLEAIIEELSHKNVAEMCVHARVLPPSLTPRLLTELVNRRDEMPLCILAAAFCGLTRCGMLGLSMNNDLCTILGRCELELEVMPPSLVVHVGLAAATAGCPVHAFFQRLFAHLPVKELKLSEVTNVWLMLATIDDWPISFLTRLDQRTRALIEDANADIECKISKKLKLNLDDCVTLLWSLVALEYRSDEILPPLLQRVAQEHHALSGEQRNQVHQVVISLKLDPPSWDVPPELISASSPGEMEAENLEQAEEIAAWFRAHGCMMCDVNVCIEDLYRADVLVGGRFFVVRAEVPWDPWVRLKRQHVEKMGYEYVEMPDWESLSERERREQFL